MHAPTTLAMVIQGFGYNGYLTAVNPKNIGLI